MSPSQHAGYKLNVLSGAYVATSAAANTPTVAKTYTAEECKRISEDSQMKHLLSDYKLFNAKMVDLASFSTLV